MSRSSLSSKRKKNRSTHLSRWMSHRLAELLLAGRRYEEADREADESDPKLWSHRSAWPDGWPPPATERLRRGLAEPEGSHPPNTPKDKSFLACLQELGEPQSKEYAIWLRLRWSIQSLVPRLM